MAEPPDLSSAYSDENVLFRALGRMGWDHLLNIGYYSLPILPTLALATATGPGPFQRRLAHRSLALLEVASGDWVLDVGCGRGYTTARLARAGCQALGVDIQLRQIDQSLDHYGTYPRTRFAVADATSLPPEAAGVRLTEGSFDRVHCLEAGLHFGRRGRRAFLGEAFRVLRPGGRLVLVDVTGDDAGPGGIDAQDPDGLVRASWRFETLESIPGYLAAAREKGFTVRGVTDWTQPVMRRAARMCGHFAGVAERQAGRRALCLRWPGLRALTAADWARLIRTVRAHETIGYRATYTGLTLDKPS